LPVLAKSATTRAFVLLLCAGSIAGAACSLFIDPSEVSSGDGDELDSGHRRDASDIVSVEEGGRPVELGDSGDGCTPTNVLVENEMFQPANPAWLALGTATMNAPVQGWTQLTGMVPSSAGAVMWGNKVDLTEFDLSATFSIEKPDGGADGLAFIWGKKLGPGGAGGGKGFQGGIDGYAVEIDTYISATDDPADAVAPYVALVPDRIPFLYLARANLPKAVVNAMSHTLQVGVHGGKVNVQVDGVAVLKDEVIPAYQGFLGHWGFSAGTGSYVSTHRVQKITMKTAKATCN
jgi:hypothetical protein